MPDLKPAVVRPVRAVGLAARPTAAAPPAPGSLRMAPDEQLAAALAEADALGLDRLTDAYIEDLAEALIARQAAIQAHRLVAVQAHGGVAFAAHVRDNAIEVADLKGRVQVVREVIAERQRGSIDD
jgi:hypothetical protein